MISFLLHHVFLYTELQLPQSVRIASKEQQKKAAHHQQKGREAERESHSYPRPQAEKPHKKATHLQKFAPVIQKESHSSVGRKKKEAQALS
jgi:hypothetical protein